jgi:membrane protein
MALWLIVVYTLAPSHRSVRPQRALWGSLIATALWLVAASGYSATILRFGRFNATYGALGGTAATMIWLYLSAATVLLGAELNARLADRWTPPGDPNEASSSSER